MVEKLVEEAAKLKEERSALEGSVRELESSPEVQRIAKSKARLSAIKKELLALQEELQTEVVDRNNASVEAAVERGMGREVAEQVVLSAPLNIRGVGQRGKESLVCDDFSKVLEQHPDLLKLDEREALRRLKAGEELAGLRLSEGRTYYFTGRTR